MAEFSLQIPADPPFAWRADGIAIAELTSLSVAYLMAKRGRAADLAKEILTGFGVALPTTPKAVRCDDMTFIWAGPDQWLVTATGDLYERLRVAADGLAAVSEQSDGRLIFCLSGPLARDVLARGCPLDMHPAVFVPGDAALSKIGLIGVHLWQVDTLPTYHMAILRSFGQSFRDWLVEAANSTNAALW